MFAPAIVTISTLTICERPIRYMVFSTLPIIRCKFTVSVYILVSSVVKSKYAIFASRRMASVGALPPKSSFVIGII